MSDTNEEKPEHDAQVIAQHDAELVHGGGHEPVNKRAAMVAFGGALLMLLLAFVAIMMSGGVEEGQNLTAHPIGIMMVIMFVVGYGLVMLETKLHVLKCIPTLLGGGLMWMVIAAVYMGDHKVEHAFKHALTEYAELLLFLLVAVSYVTVLRERDVFNALRSFLVRKGYGYKQLFWITGVLAFFISPVADNLTTALILCSVVLVSAGGNKAFIALACINIVNAANAGGAFSPFGDITTLMVWQAKKVDFFQFFWLLPASAVMFVIPAWWMSRSLPEGAPATVEGEKEVKMKRGAKRVIALFGLTIFTAVSFHLVLHMPPMAGMMLGLGLLGVFAYFLQISQKNEEEDVDLFDMLVQAAFEADTFLFFYGVIMMVGALGFLGYLTMVSSGLYDGLGFTSANVILGVVSAVVDNIPVMFAVLGMSPEMGLEQWLLITLTCGVGGSLLSIGSAAGVALMGVAVKKDEQGRTVEKYYTFGSHLKQTPILVVAYGVSIAVHLFVVVPIMNAVKG